MRSFSTTLPREVNTVEIDVLADLHLGSTKCNLTSIKERIDLIKNRPNRYCIVLGDLINNSTKTSVGDVYAEPLSPMQQIKLAVELLRPIKDKIIFITAGNHERRTYRQDGIDLIHFVATELGLQDKYDYCSGVIFLHYGTNTHDNSQQWVRTIYATHGDGQGGKTPGGRLNGATGRAQIIPNADIIITGHTHSPIGYKEAYYSVDTRHDTVKCKDRLIVNVGSALSYEEYAELVGMKPSSSANPIIVLSNLDMGVLL